MSENRTKGKNRMAVDKKVSVGLPVYNGEKYLSKSIESVLAQDFGDFDMLISDNSSTDGTWDICNNYARIDKRIRLNRNNRNLGVIANSQLVESLTHGQYFMWHAHDDLLLPSYISSCYQVLETDREVAVCYSKTTFIDENDDELFSLFLDEPRMENDCVERFQKHFGCNFPSYSYYGLIRRESLKFLGQFGDWDLHSHDIVIMRLLSISGKISQIPQVMRLFRISTDRNSYLKGFVNYPGTGARVSIFPNTRDFVCLISRIVSNPFLSPQTKKLLTIAAINIHSLKRIFNDEVNYYRAFLVYILYRSRVPFSEVTLLSIIRHLRERGASRIT